MNTRLLRDFIKLFPGVECAYSSLVNRDTASTPIETNSAVGKQYYVIWRHGGGFFSIISTVLARLQIADREGLLPIVDLANFASAYQEVQPVKGVTNVWEYYFEPIGEVQAIENYSKQEYFVTDGSHPKLAPMSISASTELLSYWNKYVKIRPEINSSILDDCEYLSISLKTLGVHFRGKEMRTAPGHPFPPTFRQICREIDEALAGGNFEQIFLVTEGKRYLRKFQARYGERLKYTYSFRSNLRNMYKIYPRSNHRYLLGLEILKDTMILSRCGGLISGSSNESEAATLLNNGEFSINIQIRNGTNSNNAFLAKFAWYWKVQLISELKNARI